MNPDLQSFLHAWTGGADVSDVERERLLRRFENDAAFRAECGEEIRLLGMIKAAQSPSPRWLDLHDALNVSSATPEDAADDLASRVLDRLRVEPLKSVGSRWLSWRPLTAAAAGLVIGMFCTREDHGLISAKANRRRALKLRIKSKCISACWGALQDEICRNFFRCGRSGKRA